MTTYAADGAQITHSFNTLFINVYSRILDGRIDPDVS